MFAQRLTIVAFALTFYCLGTTYFEAFVNYRTWGFIGSPEFRSYHRALTPLVVKVMLIPIAVYVICLVALVAARDTSVPRFALIVSLALVLVAVLSSAFIQIPIQRSFDREGLSTALLQRLITTDLALRKVPLGLNALLWLAMFWRRSPSVWPS
jgi:hypothetical protein